PTVRRRTGKGKRFMRITKNLVSGFVFVATAAVFGFVAAGYDMGMAARVGPGMFPFILSLLLGALGVAVMATGLRRDAPAFGGLTWRGVVLIVGSPLAFVGSLAYVGLVPATALLAFIGSFASTTMTIKRAALSALGLAIAVWLILMVGLGIPIPPFKWLY